jgi:hypothetical protein
MIGNPFIECWQIGEDICEPNPCGKNSRCVKEPEPRCLCLPDFYGQPPNCREGCDDDSECGEKEICTFDNLCEVGCRYDKDCKSDEYCDKYETQKCKKGCRSEDDCNEKEICEKNSRTCVRGCIINKHCDEGEFCDYRNNECVNPCEKYLPCGFNATCKSFGHSRIVKCSCEEGFTPKAGEGCDESSNITLISTENLNCSNYCAKYAECDFVDEKIECHCPDEVFGGIFNPFESCIPSNIIPPICPRSHAPSSAKRKPSKHCKHASSLECSTRLSPRSLVALAG